MEDWRATQWRGKTFPLEMEEEEETGKDDWGEEEWEHAGMKRARK